MHLIAQDAWDVEEDDFGEPMVFHRHPYGDATAYLTDFADGSRIATCAECHEEIEVAREDQVFTRSRIPSRERQGPTSPA